MKKNIFMTFSLLLLLQYPFSGNAQSVKWYPLAPPRQEFAKGEVLLPASRDYHYIGGVPRRILFNNWIRDPYVLKAPDGYFYMVGTAGITTMPEELGLKQQNGWWYNDGVPLWRSKDLENWETMGFVWQLDRDATWAKEYKYSPNTRTPDNAKVRAVWAPEIHYIKGNYWITYSMNYNGTGILRSTSGKPEGPYEDLKTDGSMGGIIDASLFEDTDGEVYFMTDGYNIARMKPDMSGLAEDLHRLKFSPEPPWAEGITMMKINNRYVWLSAANTFIYENGKKKKYTYDCFSATAPSIYGPYTNRYRAITFAGHNNIFNDEHGNFWSTQFHPQPYVKDIEQPALVPVEIDSTGYITIKRAYPKTIWKYTDSMPAGDWQSAVYDDDEWEEGESGFGDPEIQNTGAYTVVGTAWKGENIWLRKDFKLKKKALTPALFTRYTGKIEVWINGKLAYDASGCPDEYLTLPIEAELLKKGKNSIAVKLTNEDPLPYIDLGIVDLDK